MRALRGVVAASVLAAGAGSCSADAESVADSPCVAFAKASPVSLRTEPLSAQMQAGTSVRVRSGAGRTYVLGADGKLGLLGGDAALAIAVGGVGGIDFAVTRTGTGVTQAFVARWTAVAGGASTTFELVRFTSADGGLSFDAASQRIVLTSPGGRAAGEAASLAFGREGLLFVALGDAEPLAGGAPTLLGSILRLDVSGDTYAIPPDNPFASGASALPPIWVTGVHQPRGLDVDPATGDLWLTDFSERADTTYVHSVVRGGIKDLAPMLSLPAVDRRVAFGGGHVYRGKLVPSLIGRYVYSASNGALIAIDRFGPSGPPQATKLTLGLDGPIGRDADDELVITPAAGSGGVARVALGSPPAPAPASLLATKCWDFSSPAGAPAGAIPYDVTTPLWSDGAAKERFVVVPKGGKITARADGDLVFPVGTVAVKTFALGGKRVETRLLVQHELEDWTGYSYAWNEAGTDAELVQGNREAKLPDGKSWYFPSTTDCAACHTPAAGYTLGLEAKQLAGRGDALARLEARLEAPIDRAALGTLVPADAPPPATPEARARSYLHSNCSMCHREGSVTGTVVDLDLRSDTPLSKTGLCKEPQAGAFDIPAARIVAPGDPARSVLLARMRTLDERRMPKLASRVVDEAGIAAVEAWITSLAACP